MAARIPSNCSMRDSPLKTWKKRGIDATGAFTEAEETIARCGFGARDWTQIRELLRCGCQPVCAGPIKQLGFVRSLRAAWVSGEWKNGRWPYLPRNGVYRREKEPEGL
jgi:hypothetical protein